MEDRVRKSNIHQLRVPGKKVRDNGAKSNIYENNV